MLDYTNVSNWVEVTSVDLRRQKLAIAPTSLKRQRVLNASSAKQGEEEVQSDTLDADPTSTWPGFTSLGRILFGEDFNTRPLE